MSTPWQNDRPILSPEDVRAVAALVEAAAQPLTVLALAALWSGLA